MSEKITFVIPCYRSSHTITAVVDEIEEKLSDLGLEFQVVLVNDSSPDDTWMVLKELSRRNYVTAIDLARNFGQHAAIMAGLHYAEGDMICCLDDDGQTPVSEFHKLYEKIKEGYDVVYAAYDEKKHSRFRNMGSRLNSMMLESFLNKPKDLYMSSYFLAKRFVIDKILEYDYPYPYLMGLVLRTTNKIVNVPVEHQERREGESGYSMGKLLALWMNGFTAFSVKPLRVASLLGGILAAFGIIYLIYTLVNKIINPDAPLGWTSIMGGMFLIGSMILIMLGIIGEYLGRLYISENRSPQYVIREVSKDRDEEN